jgi:uncharacterized protein
MNVQTKNILTSFDALPETAKHEVAFEILRRTRDFELPPLTDDDLVANAEAVFLALDQRELSTQSQKKPKMAGKFVLTATASGQFVFNLIAGNGQVILTSQAFGDKAGAANGIASVKTNAIKYERRKAVTGDPYFVLIAANGQIIGRSEMYTSEAAMENGITSVIINAPDAIVVDSTQS